MKTFAIAAFCFVIGLFALDRALPPDMSRLAHTGTVVLDRDDRVLSLLPAPGGVWRFAARVEDVSPIFLDTLIRIEDRHFWRHPGVNPLALGRAALQDLRAGRIVSGGSTITMQAARLLEPRPRNLGAKLIEIARAVQLELRFSKREILGIWMTLAPMGGNLEGVRAGALAWFGVPAQNLEADQAALLVAIPRRPEALRPDRHLARARSTRDRVLAAMADMPAALPVSMPVPGIRAAMPHLARLAVGGQSPVPTLHTTLSRPLQITLQRLADERLADLPANASLAIVIADAASREIRAIVSGGSAGGEGRAGALDLTRALRSPGSALKPFIYAMAFEDGVAAPSRVVSDLPRRFGGYAPENFDRGFAGTVTAAEALRRSLNLPAVALLDRIGPLRFAVSLRAAGVPLRLPSGADPSLPLALGGAGIDLRHLAALYAALATDGSVMPLHLVADPRPASHPLLSRRAAEDVAEVLTQPLPDGGRAGIAWKTGTSWGGRDAWAMGFDRSHVVGVWIGRPDGTPLPGATGRSLALPLLGRVFDLLPAAPRDPPRSFVASAHHGWRADSADGLRLLFPPPEAVITADGPVTIKAMGGRRPIAFMVDGAPVPADPARREASWTPSGPGFYRVTILDAEGTAAGAAVRVR